MSQSSNIVQYEFDALAPNYETNRLSSWYKAHSHEIISHCPQLNDNDILDIGCGTGYLLRHLIHKYPGNNAIGLDISAKMIAQAKKNSANVMHDNLHFICDDWENLSEQTRQWLSGFNFKLIICANALHYFVDPVKAAENMFRMLGKDGILLVLEREKSSSFLTLLWGFLHRYLIKDQVKFYEVRELVDFLKKTGFDEVKVVSAINKYFWKGKLYTSIALIKCQKITDSN